MKSAAVALAALTLVAGWVGLVAFASGDQAIANLRLLAGILAGLMVFAVLGYLFALVGWR